MCNFAQHIQIHDPAVISMFSVEYPHSGLIDMKFHDSCYNEAHGRSYWGTVPFNLLAVYMKDVP